MTASLPPEFPRRKLRLALTIMSVGMLIALVWNGIEGWGLGKKYPYNTFLFYSDARFGDFTDNTFYAAQSNPYADPYAQYLPFAWVFFRALGALPYYDGLTVFLFGGLAGLFLLLVIVLARVVESSWQRVALSFLFLAVSYPVITTLDRGNLEIFLALGVGGALLFFSRRRYGLGALCLLPVVSFKLYPALFLLLLLRQRRMEWIAGSVIAFFILVFVSMAAIALPLQTGLEFYGRNLVFLQRFYVYENYALGGSASLWNTYKIGLISASQLGLIPSVDFSFDAPFTNTSYVVYSGCTILLAGIIALYVCVVEKEYLRCAVVVLLYLSTATPFGADYRLLYANIALVVLIVIATCRAHDVLALVLIALAMIPKKEVILTYAGRTETGLRDVPIQAVLNPLLLLAALLLLLYDARTALDWRWTRLRWGRLTRALLPRLNNQKRLRT
jgi:hypothetical protein